MGPGSNGEDPAGDRLRIRSRVVPAVFVTSFIVLLSSVCGRETEMDYLDSVLHAYAITGLTSMTSSRFVPVNVIRGPRLPLRTTHANLGATVLFVLHTPRPAVRLQRLANSIPPLGIVMSCRQSPHSQPSQRLSLRRHTLPQLSLSLTSLQLQPPNSIAQPILLLP